MSMNFSDKIKLIRNYLNLSQEKFSQLTGISASSIKRIEGGGDTTFATLQKITTHSDLQKYTLWLVSDTTNLAAGQISPGDIEPEQARKTEALSQEEFDKNFIKTVGDSLLMFCHLGWFTPDLDNKKVFDDSSTIILKDVRSLIEGHYKTAGTTSVKSA
jgi:transcriptional regulator with XRE-family HTH domain